MSGNTVIGTNASFNISSVLKLYHQFSVRDEKLSQYAFQLGAKYFIHHNVMVQAEYNSISEATGNNLYTHYNESLNSPYGSDSDELIGIAEYKKNRWLSRIMLNYGMSSTKEVQFFDIRQSYLVNPSFNFTVHLGAQVREQQLNDDFRPLIADPTDPSSFYVYFGLSTNLQNIYFNY